jgi:hypothetical protein
MAINNTQQTFVVTYSLKRSLPGQCAGCGALNKFKGLNSTQEALYKGVT